MVDKASLTSLEKGPGWLPATVQSMLTSHSLLYGSDEKKKAPARVDRASFKKFPFTSSFFLLFSSSTSTPHPLHFG
jgi:hypothetical protein